MMLQEPGRGCRGGRRRELVTLERRGARGARDRERGKAMQGGRGGDDVLASVGSVARRRRKGWSSDVVGEVDWDVGAEARRSMCEADEICSSRDAKEKRRWAYTSNEHHAKTEVQMCEGKGGGEKMEVRERCARVAKDRKVRCAKVGGRGMTRSLSAGSSRISCCCV